MDSLNDTQKEEVARIMRNEFFGAPIKDWADPVRSNWMRDFEKMTAALDRAGYRVIAKTE